MKKKISKSILSKSAFEQTRSLESLAIRLLQRIWKEDESVREELANKERVAYSRASNVIRELLNRKLLSFSTPPTEEHQLGRRIQRIKIHPDLGFTIGIAVNSSGLRALLIKPDGEIKAIDEHPQCVGPSNEDLLPFINESIQKVSKTLDSSSLVGIGIGLAGRINPEEGTSISFPSKNQWKKIQLKSELERQWEVPVSVENDIQASALAEYRFGGRKAHDTMLYCQLGYGLGLGIVSSGKLHRGSNNAYGEFGHSVIDPFGPLCYCGNYGCLESLVSPHALSEQLKQAGKGHSQTQCPIGKTSLDTMMNIIDASSEGDRLAQNILQRAGERIGAILANVVTILAPSCLVLGGAFNRKPQGILYTSIQEAVKNKSYHEFSEKISIEPASLDAKGCALGAALQSWNHFFDFLKPKGYGK